MGISGAGWILKSVFVAGAVSCLSTAAWAQQTGTQVYLQTDPDGLVVFEAEDFNTNTAQGGRSWSLSGAHAGASGGDSMEATPDSGTTRDTGYAANSPRLNYRVNFIKTGVHRVWVRGRNATANPGNGDSVHVGLNGVETGTADKVDGFGGAFGWSNLSAAAPVTINITRTGVHVVNLWMREDGFIVDMILITSSTAYVPSNAPPPAVYPQTTQPAAPTLPALDPVTVGNVVFDWADVPVADSYKVQRSTVANFATWTSVGTPQGSAFTNNAANLVLGTTYYYRAVTVDAGVDSNPSNVIQTTVHPPQPVAPTLAALAGDARVTLNWSSVANASGYQLEVDTDIAFPQPPTYVVNGADVLTALNEGLSNGQTYHYRVRGVNSNPAPGAWSATASATPQPRENDHEEGFLKDTCEAGSVASAGAGVARLAVLAAFAALAFAALRRR